MKKKNVSLLPQKADNEEEEALCSSFSHNFFS